MDSRSIGHLRHPFFPDDRIPVNRAFFQELQAKGFYRLPEVAKLLGYTYKHVYNLVTTGQILSVRIHARKRTRFLIPRPTVRKLLQEHLKGRV